MRDRVWPGVKAGSAMVLGWMFRKSFWPNSSRPTFLTAISRQCFSSANNRPSFSAVSNSMTGERNEEPSGPRARASQPSTPSVRKSRMGW